MGKIQICIEKMEEYMPFNELKHTFPEVKHDFDLKS